MLGQLKKDQDENSKVSCFSSVSRYNIIFMVITYFLPVLSMSVTYTAVSLELWNPKIIGQPTPAQMEAIKGKRRVRKSH